MITTIAESTKHENTGSARQKALAWAGLGPKRLLIGGKWVNARASLASVDRFLHRSLRIQSVHVWQQLPG